MSVIKILLADDDALIRDGLSVIFQYDPRFELVGVVTNGMEAYRACRDQEVDVALLDIRMPELSGVDATLKIVGECETKVLLLTTFDEDDLIDQAFQNGASGYLLKNNSADQIKNAVISVSGGNMVVQDVVMDYIANKDKRKLSDHKEEKLRDLTNREREIVDLVTEGLTNKEIAEALYISEGTVKNSVSTILSKLALKHRTQIVIYMLKE